MQPDITLPKEPKIKNYTVLLNQSGTDDPVITILQNTLGFTPVWTRNSTGKYIFPSSFKLGKVIAFISPNNAGNATVEVFYADSEIQVLTYDPTNLLLPADGQLTDVSLTILVYE